MNPWEAGFFGVALGAAIGFVTCALFVAGDRAPGVRPHPCAEPLPEPLPEPYPDEPDESPMLEIELLDPATVTGYIRELADAARWN